MSLMKGIKFIEENSKSVLKVLGPYPSEAKL